jgi:hypothetical protein
MREFQIIKLHLASPLYYERTDDPGTRWFHDYPTRAVAAETPVPECLFGFEIKAEQYRSIEPDAASFIIEPPFFKGSLSPREADFTLEAGLYLFTQSRESLDREGILELALEIQKEGLWEGYALDRKLFLRYVFEDGAVVTQVWRPALGMERPNI